MRLAALACLLVLLLPQTGSRAADLAAYPPAPVVSVPHGWFSGCVLARPTRIYRAPLDQAAGLLPAGLAVEVIEPDWSPVTDLWVRLRAPREGIYYGWVYTRGLFCH